MTTARSLPRPASKAMATLLAVLALSLVAAACSSGTSRPAASSTTRPATTLGPGTTVANSTKAGDVLQGTAARLPATRDDAIRGGGAVRALAADGYAALARLPASDGKNLVFSPYSVKMALAMVLQGARGASAEELAAVLQPTPDGKLAISLNSLEQALTSRSGPKADKDRGRTGEVALHSANSLWVQAGYPVKQPFLDAMARYFGAPPRVADFRNQTRQAQSQINSWVADQTAQRIKDLLSTLDPQTRLVLVNALYLKAPWLTPFPKSATADAPFHRNDGSTVTAPFMHLTTTLASAQGPNWKSVTVPYLGNQLALTLILPDAGQLTTVEQALTQAGLGMAMSDAHTGPVALALPKFNLSQHTSLKALLESMGVHASFDPSLADFSAMSGSKGDLYLRDVVHESNITIDEEGTEAAAATAAVMDTKAARVAPTPVPMVLDRPFLFVVSDQGTKAPLFIGRVLDPTQQ